MRKNQKTSLTTYTHICIIKANTIHMEGKIEGEGHSGKNRKIYGVRRHLKGYCVVGNFRRRRCLQSGRLSAVSVRLRVDCNRALRTGDRNGGGDRADYRVRYQSRRARFARVDRVDLQIPAILRANFIKPPAARPRNTARREKGNRFISMNCKCIKTHDLCRRIPFR